MAILGEDPLCQGCANGDLCSRGSERAVEVSLSFAKTIDLPTDVTLGMFTQWHISTAKYSRVSLAPASINKIIS